MMVGNIGGKQMPTEKRLLEALEEIEGAVLKLRAEDSLENANALFGAITTNQPLLEQSYGVVPALDQQLRLIIGICEAYRSVVTAAQTAAEDSPQRRITMARAVELLESLRPFLPEIIHPR